MCIYVCYILVCACARVRMYFGMLCMSVCAHVIHQFVSSSMLWTRVFLYARYAIGPHGERRVLVDCFRALAFVSLGASVVRV